MRLRDYIVFVFTLAMFGWLAYSAPAKGEFRVNLGWDVIHMPGYSTLGLRYGDAWGVRAGLLRAPGWASSVPDDIKVAKPQFDLQDIAYYALDREFCGQRWCGALGVARLSDTTWANGTQWNFLLGGRYKIDRHWSLEFTHFSHGRSLGIAEDKSNRGWNLLGVSYGW